MTAFTEQALATKRQEHANLVEAILARDSDRACAMMYEHLMTPVPIIARELESRGLL